MREGVDKARILTLCVPLLAGACRDAPATGQRGTVDPVAATKKTPTAMPEPASRLGNHPSEHPAASERPIPSCETANPDAARFREVRLRGEAPHLGVLSEPGYFNVIIIGAEWCQPCGRVLHEIPRWVSAYPKVVFTYVDVVDEGLSVSRFMKQNEIDEIPYAYLSNDCGYGLSWLRSDLEQGRPLDVKIAHKLEQIFGPPPSAQTEPVPVQPELLTMAPPRDPEAPKRRHPAKEHESRAPSGDSKATRAHEPVVSKPARKSARGQRSHRR
jgi:hypothetical protein